MKWLSSTSSTSESIENKILNAGWELRKSLQSMSLERVLKHGQRMWEHILRNMMGNDTKAWRSTCEKVLSRERNDLGKNNRKTYHYDYITIWYYLRCFFFNLLVLLNLKDMISKGKKCVSAIRKKSDKISHHVSVNCRHQQQNQTGLKSAEGNLYKGNRIWVGFGWQGGDN